MTWCLWHFAFIITIRLSYFKEILTSSATVFVRLYVPSSEFTKMFSGLYTLESFASQIEWAVVQYEPNKIKNSTALYQCYCNVNLTFWDFMDFKPWNSMNMFTIALNPKS